MNENEFHAVVIDQTGLDIQVADLSTPLDEVSGWDSVYLLKLITALEQQTGRAMPISAMLEATSLDAIRLAVPA
ncbi:Phosphopantetheine attachment site [Mycobacteroides abscessus subsp. abscessus]|uniref:Carrier domain-containing protein n=7 Tax=Mycobacteroides abscessus TaxID=36809 RepID=B1MF41_MYCA9|nr:acyl carrier protein [Mycobacteroides abscessus]ETZ90663.1 phosphopantetheine attachment site family protein [Mycobacteroides abscessus MAB_030201_1075]ETZ93431.1 phosphopantetheine attachment site family protein [Mycobacteroides abscessus MAB_030201_1061]EUA46332.1 phosphopantetheine attachment site family protein [Mycobacteroides abscessus 21]EUA62242.1 phosphopantetheine attachment site family protein [Mycobacteroides abscessus 1948]ALM17750.1 acyl carrier protein [Mycobacteroides absces